MKFIDLSCPHCRAQLKVDSGREYVYCEYCGAKIMIDDEINQVHIDNAEEAGFQFEKGRQRAQVEIQQNKSRANADQYQQPSLKKRKTWLWVLGWICIFPLPLTILLLRKKNMKSGIKYGIIGMAWLAYLIFALSGKSINSSSNERSEANHNVPVATSFATKAPQYVEGINPLLTTEQPVATQNIPVATSVATEAPQNIEKVFELNSLQLLFVNISENTTRDEIDKYISEHNLLKTAFTHDSAYYIGYDAAAIRKRGRDRVGEAVDVDFYTSGDPNKIGFVKAAKYASVKYSEGYFSYDGVLYESGVEAIQQYLNDHGE